MNTPTARQAPALPARPLIALTALVILAHVLLLQAAPLAWGPVPDPQATAPRPFITRTLEIKPEPVVTSAPAATPVRPRPVRRRAPVSQANRAPAPVSTAPAAIESIAPSADDSTSPVDPQTPPPEVTATTTEPVAPTPVEAAPPPDASTALTIPGSVRLKYVMTGRSKNMNYSAFAQLDWLQDGQTYDAKMVVSALFLGSRSMTSSGRITADGLAPTRFLDKSRSERAAHFEEDKGKISFSANTPDAPWLRGAQDRLSVFLQLGSLLAGAPASYPVGSSVSLYTAGPRDADTWTFTVESEETLQLPAGEAATLKLTRKPQRDYDQTVEIWFAPSMDYLPVRSRITQQNGDFVDQQLRVVEKP
ncbi:MAG TPA: DUF3108 domain-containing protein [Polaromonas sp.]|jgi:hypothetical protein|uniref:DUF3108 domain-containing protein n=1 Tax=unclassified Polaromonas TaxID=2638319 RepID=UPI000BDDB8D9|nr:MULTISPECIES: DUF3108 domain-containing protein [unclassified Polaromonas]OYY33141.1 MAG: hypothetical protein B7Y60_19860 [Polaromonas sp. 35-63-35]OYZ17325.1 MAG: hypothetical protein B7Y28_19660 [Polaromonas sp. 16-63-31]OYZ76559.1 MAG: hypothetical protein B7Y09_19855 [Polaromonas sp. 24-63-21]OZA47689.1 MAG: hypothetical protein B7X88_20995 [Polaromonas sp. 17-63-33]OZA85779.1 MAG: hypothetical protein B7X65_20150 [Polaromonas sp. 39-63-25]